MDINFTLIVQMLVFAAFVGFTMKFVWPPLAKALEERQDKIAEGLAAAERGRKEWELAQLRSRDELKDAKVRAAEILEKASKRAVQLIEEAKDEAKLEALRQGKLAHAKLEQDVNYAKENLRQQVAGLAVVAAELILKREINTETHSQLLDNLIKEI